jgi:hypothetical protein
MNTEEINEFHILSNKRERGTLTDLEYKRYLILMDKSFNEGLQKVADSWKKAFEL